MKRILTIFLLLSIFILVSKAQNKLLTIEDATNLNPNLLPSSLSHWQWFWSSDTYVYVAANCLISGQPGKAQKDTLLRLDTINARLAAFREEKLKSFPSLTVLYKNTFIFTWKNKLWKFELYPDKLSEVNKIPEKANNIDIEMKRQSVAYTKENNLFISVNGEEKPLTSEINPGIVYGSGKVHRNEFGITKGTFWSPEGNKLAFYRMDETMVTDYPLVNIDDRIAKLENTKYPMTGMTSHQVTLGIYDLRSEKTVFLKTQNPFGHLPSTIGEQRTAIDDYLTNITWSPDEKFIYIAILNREQDHLVLNKYDVNTGEFLKTLFEEKNKKYIEPLNKLFFLNNDPAKFIWQSQRDGFNHLYLYDCEGNLLKQLTKGQWVVKELLSVSPKNTLVFFMANKDNPLDNQLYSVNTESGEISRITMEPGTHRPQVSPDSEIILDSLNSYNIASQYNIIDTKGKVLERLIENKNPLKEYKLGKTSVFPIKSDDNTDLYCRLIEPIDFDSTKKYPVIIYVYAGPHSQMVTDSWLAGGGLFLNYLATQGYVVFTMDSRGTSNRGLEFEQVLFRNLGSAEVEDQMKGVQYLKSRNWVDTARIGINGWSYGGFMAMSMMLKHPGVFKAVVAGGPVIDWKYYEVMYGERYMDTPETNPEGYRNSSLLNYVDKLKGKLLIIQGYKDGTVVPQNGMLFIEKCVEKGKQVDYFLYPRHEHNIRGKDRVHLNQKIVNYFKDYL